MSCDICHRECRQYEECTREERLPFRNYDRFFGTPERAAQSIVNANGFNKSFNYWADNDGALLCSMVPKRGNRKLRKQACIFKIWLQEECNE